MNGAPILTRRRANVTPSALKAEAVVVKGPINQREPCAEGSQVWREGGRPGVLSLKSCQANAQGGMWLGRVQWGG